jgi:hypothetical protein
VAATATDGAGGKAEGRCSTKVAAAVTEDTYSVRTLALACALQSEVTVGVPGNGFKHFIIGIVLIAVRRNLGKNVTG